MASSKKYRYPPAPPAGSESFSPDLVGFQVVEGGGLTQGNFEFTTAVVEKVNRTFDTGVFSIPYTLENLQIESIEESKRLQAKEYGVYPNYDISNVTNFSLYGSLQKRFSASVLKVINFFPAGLEVDRVYTDYTTANTASNISYDAIDDETTFDIDVTRIKNPLDIDYSVNADRNVQLRPMAVHPLRNITRNYLKYSLFIGTGETEYLLSDFDASPSLSAGTITVTVQGRPFSSTTTTESLLLRPNKYETEVVFSQDFDEIEKFLLNRLVTPKYTASFSVPREDNSGRFYNSAEKVTWPVAGLWNIDISSERYDVYLAKLNDIAIVMDSFRTNLISRFLISGSLKEFDTGDQKLEKVLQIYGRSFDETKKFIDGLAYINSVNYQPKNDIPSELLKNLAQTLGFDTNNSPITNEDFLFSIFGTKNQSIYPGQTRDKTPRELNYEYYRKIIINSGYLYKTKGTRQSIEFLMRMVGAPKALVEFNETIYMADGPININQFNEEYDSLSGGTRLEILPVLNPTDTYKVKGVTYTAFTPTSQTTFIDTTRGDYPIDEEGYPTNATFTNNYFFEMGSGWYEQTPKHRANQKLDLTNSVFTGQNPDIQTSLEPYTYGEKFFDRYREFPYMDLGYELTAVKDNLKSWAQDTTGVRKSTGAFNAYYKVNDERLVLNRKNIELYMNMGQGLVYDVWDMSRKYDYPIPSTGLTSPYPTPGGIDWTVINPRPKQKTFFEFAQTFYKNMINVRNRQTQSSKTGGYPTLQSIYWKYLTSEEAVNIPSNKYTYQKMIDFTNGIGDYWMRLVEQVVPASTLWTGGQKMSNSEFDRQKFVYRVQRGCEIVPVPCTPCSITGPLFKYDCVDQTVDCNLYPSLTFQQILNSQVTSVVSSSGYTTADCDLNSIVSSWYVDLRLDSDILVQEQFYTGYGANDAPTNSQWQSAIINRFLYLYQNGLAYSINGNTITFTNIGCMANFTDKTIYLNVGINLSINCG
jgi:hypothetical protein